MDINADHLSAASGQFPLPGSPRKALVAALAMAMALSNGVAATPAVPAPSTPTTQRSVANLDVGEPDELSLVRERIIGQSIAKRLYQDPDLIDDPIIGDAVDTIVAQLLRSARQQQLLSAEMEQDYAWHVFLGRDKSFNAFALPGGFMGLHLGLIAATNTPDELASVLAHELTHVIQRHISRGQAQANKAAPLVIAAVLLGAVAAKKSDALAQAAVVGGTALNTQLQLNYSRDMEREADRLGYAILKGAGYAPQGFVALFEKMQTANRWSDDGTFPYLRTHPLNTERVAAMQNRVQQEAPTGSPPTVTSPLAWSLIAARARAYSAVPLETLRQWATETDLPHFSNQPLEKRITSLVVASRYYQLIGQSVKSTLQLQQLQSLVQADPDASTTVRKMRAHLALDQGNWGVVGGLISATPRSRSEIQMKAQSLIGLGQAQAAAELLQVWVAHHPMDVRAWQLLAQAHERQGQTLRHIRALAEAQLAQYDPDGAIDRLKSALKLPTNPNNRNESEVDQEIITSRIKDIQTQKDLFVP